MPARRLDAYSPPEQSEAEFQDTVLDLARRLGWSLRYHTFDSRRSEAGFPDLVLVKPGQGDAPGRLILAELKRDSGTLSAEQRRWIDALDTVRHLDVRVWRPRDLDEIARLLR